MGAVSRETGPRSQIGYARFLGHVEFSVWTIGWFMLVGPQR
jgi:hypothetical protein